MVQITFRSLRGCFSLPSSLHNSSKEKGKKEEQVEVPFSCLVNLNFLEFWKYVLVKCLS